MCPYCNYLDTWNVISLIDSFRRFKFRRTSLLEELKYTALRLLDENVHFNKLCDIFKSKISSSCILQH